VSSSPWRPCLFDTTGGGAEIALSWFDYVATAKCQPTAFLQLGHLGKVFPTATVTRSWSAQLLRYIPVVVHVASVLVSVSLFDMVLSLARIHARVERHESKTPTVPFPLAWPLQHADQTSRLAWEKLHPQTVRLS
jgi:hypothetical protein